MFLINLSIKVASLRFILGSIFSYIQIFWNLESLTFLLKQICNQILKIF